MSKPYSFKSEPWLSFDKASDSIMTDDFVHDKLFTAKLASSAAKGTVNVKGSVAKKGTSVRASEEVKFWFPAWNRGGTLYVKSKGQDLKVHYDDGTRIWN